MAEKAKSGYQAYTLTENARQMLMAQFDPKFPEFIGHHITIRMGAKSTDPLPFASSIQVVGYACNDAGIEALVVEVDGTTERADGKIYHITWSLDRDAGFKPVKSNDLVAGGYTRIANPINISATATFN